LEKHLSSEIVVLAFLDEHSHGTPKVHQEASDVDIPEFRIATGIATFGTVTQNCVTQA